MADSLHKNPFGDNPWPSEEYRRQREAREDEARGKLGEALLSGDPEAMPTTARTERARKGKAARALGHRLSNKAVEYYESLGFMAFRVDYTITTKYGAAQSMDMIGIGDVLAVGHGRTVLVQSTTKEDRTAHERKLVENAKLIARVNETVYCLALNWLNHGGEIHIAMFDKLPNGRWDIEVFEVTREWLTQRYESLSAKRAKRVA